MIFLPHGSDFKKNTEGQALLLILLTMAVVLTVVLSILSRTITDITVTTREEEALRAFSAAEAGIEKALIVGSTQGPSGDASFDASVTDFGQGQTEFIYPEELFSGESATIWLVEHNDAGELVCDVPGDCFTGSQMAICWGKDGTPRDADAPAIEISIFYDADPSDETYSDVKIARATADPYQPPPRVSGSPNYSPNYFDSNIDIDCTLGGQTLEFEKNIVFSDFGIDSSTAGRLLFVKVRFFYNTDEAQPLGVDVSGSGSDLSSQGKKIESTGTSGEANRKIEVFQSFGELPPIFDAVLFSPGGIVKTPP